MMTQTHLILGLAAFGTPDKPRLVACALAGSILPDVSLYLLVGTHLLVLGTPSDIVFDQLFFSEAWQSVFRIDNSLVIWGIVFALALMVKSRAGVAFSGAALLHLVLDFAFHFDDARAHFWPITHWRFHSPVSYWDPAHYGNIVAPLEIGVSLAVAAWLLTRFKGRSMMALIGVLATIQVALGVMRLVIDFT